MARNRHYSGAALLTMLIAFGLTVVMIAACSPIPTTVTPTDVTTVAPCDHEYGPAPEGQPCVWDGGADVNGSARWIYYSQICPVRTVQDTRLVDCIPRESWGE
jgi:hypothetical protein